MAELLSVGLDVGTTSTQLILSRLTVENKASGFSVPEMVISSREILYESPIHFTPLGSGQLIDGEALARLLEEEYRRAGITPEMIDTGAVIVTGETSRKENARTVLETLAELAGKFVVTTAGPDLESVLAAKGAGAPALSQRLGKTVLHMDIGGGTSNFALIKEGKVLRTGCMNVGGRLVKLDPEGRLTYVSSVLKGIFSYKAGDTPGMDALEALAKTLAQALEMAASLRTGSSPLQSLYTGEASAWVPPEEDIHLSFSGGVADCIGKDYPPFAFGDLGPLLGKAIRESRLCQGPYSLGSQTIRATVIGAGCHSTQLSGSTIFIQNVDLPLKDLPVVTDGIGRESAYILSLPELPAPGYRQIQTLAGELAAKAKGAVYILLEQDMAKALGQALAARLPKETPILCLDGLRVAQDSFLDVGLPVGPAIPVVIKTLVFER